MVLHSVHHILWGHQLEKLPGSSSLAASSAPTGNLGRSRNWTNFWSQWVSETPQAPSLGKHFPSKAHWDFLGSPVIKTLHFISRGMGLIPGQGTKILWAAWLGQKSIEWDELEIWHHQLTLVAHNCMARNTLAIATFLVLSGIDIFVNRCDY